VCVLLNVFVMVLWVGMGEGEVLVCKLVGKLQCMCFLFIKVEVIVVNKWLCVFGLVIVFVLKGIDLMCVCFDCKGLCGC